MADFQNIFKLLKDSVLPPFCTVCGKVSPCYVCEACKSFIKLTGNNICIKCGQPFHGPGSDGASLESSISCSASRSGTISNRFLDDRSDEGSISCSVSRSDTAFNRRAGDSIICSSVSRSDTAFNRCTEDTSVNRPSCCLDGGSSRNANDKKAASGRICSLCKNENFHFYKCRSFAFYEGTAAELIKKYKYRKYYFLKDTLAGFLKTAYKNYYSEEKIDFIETVPDIRQQDFSGLGEMQEQGSNHMQILAARLAVLLNAPYTGNIKKIKKTSRQQLLDRSSRKLNPAGAFKVINRMQPQGKNYLVIDDVWTTGSTLNEVSNALKNAGADRIYLLTIARGM